MESSGNSGHCSIVRREACRLMPQDTGDRAADDSSSVVSIADWKAMADAMGLANMGRPAPIMSDGPR
jgi:hypothetical protein